MYRVPFWTESFQHASMRDWGRETGPRDTDTQREMETKIEQLADLEFLGPPVAPPLPSRAHMLGTGLRAQPWRWQTGSRYQRLGAKATSRLGSPGRALDELQPPCPATLILPNSHGTNLLYRETTGRP